MCFLNLTISSEYDWSFCNLNDVINSRPKSFIFIITQYINLMIIIIIIIIIIIYQPNDYTGHCITTNKQIILTSSNSINVVVALDI